VEARDSASFQAYQRLDLFYVENWSVSLDLAILLSTVQTVAAGCPGPAPAHRPGRRQRLGVLAAGLNGLRKDRTRRKGVASAAPFLRVRSPCP